MSLNKGCTRGDFFIPAAIALIAFCMLMLGLHVGKSNADPLKPVGECAVTQISQAGTTEFAVIDGIKKLGYNPSQVSGIHEATMKGQNLLARPHSWVTTCLTPDGTEVASVNDINAGG